MTAQVRHLGEFFEVSKCWGGRLVESSRPAARLLVGRAVLGDNRVTASLQVGHLFVAEWLVAKGLAIQLVVEGLLVGRHGLVVEEAISEVRVLAATAISCRVRARAIAPFGNPSLNKW